MLSVILAELHIQSEKRRDLWIYAQNTEISSHILVRKFCRKAQFPQSFGRIARNSAEIVPFRKISTPGN